MKKEILPKRKTLGSYSVGKITGAIFYDTRREKQGGYPIKYRVTHNKRQKYFDSGFSMSTENWNSLPRTRNKELLEIRELINNGNNVIKNHIRDLVNSENFSFETLQARLKRGDNTSVGNAFKLKIKELENNGQVGTAMIYNCTLNSISEFHGMGEIVFSRITPEWLKKYESWFIGNDKKSYATLSIYLRSLRAIINTAINEGVISKDIYPFGPKKYQIPTSPGRHMALNLKQIKTLIEHPLEPGSTAEKMRDLWLFSYLANGMNIKDLISLKWKNIEGDEIIYYREKTKKISQVKSKIVIPILDEMQKIIDKWGVKNRSPEFFIFGFLKNNGNSPERVRTVSQNVTRSMNKYLKDIAEDAGLPHISTYTARHSFATVLLRSGASIEFISEALSHKSISTTKKYLAGFESEARRKMNSNLLNFKDGKD